jgi:hypothetical protein
MKFPATMVGLDAIRGILSNCGKQIRLAVAGVAAVSLGLALGNGPGRQTFIVSSKASIADQAAALAQYAGHTL